MAVDLLTLPGDMQMPELFGWRRGSFTGAVDDYQGAVQAADGGTLFLDEIDKLSLKAQAGLLTFLESREVKRMGETRSRRADVRVVVGSNADLHSAVAEGRFREDLYYRINVLPVCLPGLDERRDEIPAWAQFMLRERHESGGLAGDVGLTSEASLALARRRWPGNLRHLSNVIRRSYALALADLESPDAGVRVELRHVTSALEMDGARASDPAVALRAAALALADVIVRWPEDRPRLELADLDAMRGAVLEALIGSVEDKEEACRLLSLESQVASRNHSRLLRRELGRWEELQAKIRF
ncbi:MAG: sigma-54-dependent Fis family transcriptional regulator [Nannocystaceae bacterium]|nr:sigma-54-dependent Fis family transcriptional regulator [Nannocystaceae bacterium]